MALYLDYFIKSSQRSLCSCWIFLIREKHTSGYLTLIRQKLVEMRDSNSASPLSLALLGTGAFTVPLRLVHVLAHLHDGDHIILAAYFPPALGDNSLLAHTLAPSLA